MLPDSTWGILLGLGLDCMLSGLKDSTLSVAEGTFARRRADLKSAAALHVADFHPFLYI
jgi:hypothetical protein